MNYEYDLFISYAQADHGWVKKYLIDALEQTDIRWHSESSFTPGTPHLLEIEASVKHSKRILVVLTPAYQAENITGFLNVLGQSYGLETNTWPVIPLILKPVKLPLRLSQLVALDFSEQENWDSQLERLLNLLQLKTIPRPSPHCPYPGIQPFSDDASYPFFGRDEEISILAHALRLHPFHAVIGPSGSGKSSLVLAGLIPALKGNKFFNLGLWDTRVLRPGSNPVAALEHILSNPKIESKDNQDIRQLVIIDQFEEVFTLVDDPTESEIFQKKLLNLLTEKNTHVLLTVRAYFYNKLMNSPLWPEIRERRLELLPLGENGLKQAIVGPAETEGVHIEAALVERLSADASGEPGILPFVQETLVLLWSRGLRRRFLPLLAYESLVLPRQVYGEQPITGLHVALTEHADNAYKKLTLEERNIAKRIFLRLVQFGEGRKHTRRQSLVKDLIVGEQEHHLFQLTLDQLTEARLLTRSGQEGDSSGSVDLAHEILIEGWPQLAEWVDKYSALEQQRRQFILRAKNWLNNNKKAGFLDDTEIETAQALMSDLNQGGLGIDLAIQEYINASNLKVKRQKKIKWLLPILAVISATSIFIGYNLLSDWLMKQQVLEMSTLIPVKGGEKTIGTDYKYAETHEKPERSISIDGFHIEAFEVSNKKYQICERVGVCQKPSSELKKYTDPSYSMHPVVGINIQQAQTFCQWLDRRLPLFAEWEITASEQINKLSQSIKQPLEKSGLFHMPVGNQDYSSTLAVNQLPNKAQIEIVTKPEKAIHLIGNVWEWATEKPFSCAKSTCEMPSDINFGIMGGSFNSQIDYTSNFHLMESNELSTSHYGFRCVKN